MSLLVPPPGLSLGRDLFPSPDRPALALHGKMETLTPLYPDNWFTGAATDPPYEIDFMGDTTRGWDKSGVAFSVAAWREVYRVLRPGAYLLAFGSPRTAHRLTVAIEDAGFEIRDTLQWIYGQGFPKSLNIGKELDEAAGATREVVGFADRIAGAKQIGTTGHTRQVLPITAPATEEAKQWEGWGTNLKPGHEPIVVARKPLSEKSVIDNILRWGTGGLNVNACRLPGSKPLRVRVEGQEYNPVSGIFQLGSAFAAGESDEGRFPTNILLDAFAADEMDRQSGIGKEGGASRFFPVFGYEDADFYPFLYNSKASQSERHAGTEEGNAHPTIKPIAVMRWLLRLITPPGGTILDPFAGSFTTLVAARRENILSVGFEMRAEAVAVGRDRLIAEMQTVEGELYRRRQGKPKAPKAAPAGQETFAW